MRLSSPDKSGIQKINLPEAKRLDDPYVIQCYDASSLPRDPSGRLQKITEMMQSGLISPQEGRRLLDFPDIEQDDKLANAAEERILKILDEIVEDGKFTTPDTWMAIQLAVTKVTQYINLYSSINLEEEKAQMLRDFFSQLQAMQQASQPPPPPLGAGPAAPLGYATQASPMPPPQSDMIAYVPGVQGIAA